MPSKVYKCETCRYLFSQDAPCVQCGPVHPQWKLREGVKRDCLTCGFGLKTCPRCSECGVSKDWTNWEPRGKYPIEIEVEHIIAAEKRITGRTATAVMFDEFAAWPKLQCLGGPKDGEIVEVRGKTYQCRTLDRRGFATHLYVPENRTGRLCLVYNGEVREGQEPTREEPEMKTTRAAYLLIKKETIGADGKWKDDEKVLVPEGEGFATIDVDKPIENGTIREAVLEKHHELLAGLGLKFKDVEVLSPFAQG